MTKTLLAAAGLALGLAGTLPAVPARADATPPAPVTAPAAPTAAAPSFDGAPDGLQMSRGAYLATAADCAACHTAEGGRPFAGGYAINSPMGAIYSSNITPSKAYGIGGYSERDFARALRDGIRKDGARLYPAMPYPSYSKMSDADIRALYDYFMTEVMPVETPAPKTALPFPFSLRVSMIGWDWLYGGGSPLQAEAGQSDAWNRGRYLVEGPAHCGTCHTPRNLVMGPVDSRGLGGAMVGAWYAPNLTPGSGGIGDWSDRDLEAYLATGISDRARASGPMAEAVEHSFQHMAPADIAAMVAYLRSVPAVDATTVRAAPAETNKKPDGFLQSATQDARGLSRLPATASGAVLYQDACASCHQPDGRGSADGYYPALKGNLTAESGQSANLVATILHGVSRTVAGTHVLMPGFGPDSLVQPLSDAQIAQLANYVMDGLNDGQARLSPADVTRLRQGGPVAPIARLSSPGLLAGIAVAGLVILVLVLAGLRLLLRRRRRAA